MLTKQKIKAINRRKDYEKRRNIFRNRPAQTEEVEVKKMRPAFSITGEPMFNILPGGGKQRVNEVISTKTVERKVKKNNSRSAFYYLLPKSKKFKKKKHDKNMEMSKVQSDINDKNE